MQRFYFEALESIDDSVTVKNPNLLSQLIKVLRIKIWDEIIFFNWVDDLDYIYKIISIDKREVYLEKQWYIENNSENSFDINIINAIPNKLEKIELILQKWVEVWVSNFLFFRSNRSQKLNLSNNKIDRFKKIIVESVEQSSRSRVPELVFLDDLNLNDFNWANNIIFHTSDKNSISLKDINLNGTSDINIFVWPEWWFDENEIKSFEEHNFKKVFLGNRILRTETTWFTSAFFIIQNNL